MAFKKTNLYNSPNLDASLGLIFRLNTLWAKVDNHAEAADYDGWNILLDRIYCNLLYREDIVVKEDPVTKKITSVGLSEEDEKVYRYLTTNIFKAKADYFKTSFKNPKDKTIMKSRWYRAVMLKDIWARKHMQKLKLYLKEVEHSPGSSLFGGPGA
jgi:hypothetical protein